MRHYNLFQDAHRRVCIAGQRNEKDRSRMWTGLGYPSEFKGIIADGWMKPIHYETPRALNWYTFTEAGWAEYDLRYINAPDYFSEEFGNYSPGVSGRVAVTA